MIFCPVNPAVQANWGVIARQQAILHKQSGAQSDCCKSNYSILWYDTPLNQLIKRGSAFNTLILDGID